MGQCGALFPVILVVQRRLRRRQRPVQGFLSTGTRGAQEGAGSFPTRSWPQRGIIGGKRSLEAEVGAFQRYLGISSEAGLEQAIRLSNSKDASERDFAVNLLFTIGTPKAWKYIAILTKDADYSVAFEAKRYLSFSQRGQRRSRRSAQPKATNR